MKSKKNNFKNIKTIIQIVPRLPPAIDGVGDYALNLAQQLYQDFGIETQFLVSDPSWIGDTHLEKFTIYTLSIRSSVSLLSLLREISIDSSVILLHYVGYGYAKKGCPIWLVQALERWKTERNYQKIITMFHEVYAAGRPPWTSAFWLFPLQKKLATHLVQMSDRILTSKQTYADLLYKMSRKKQSKIPALPVFSGIGEISYIQPLAERQRRLVIFGSRGNRVRVYQEAFSQLSQACKHLEIEEVWDIGTPTNFNLSTVNGISIVEMGQLPAAKISRIFSNSIAGFLCYPSDFLAKSTIFAAYCAHGLLPINVQCQLIPVDGIQSGVHYWIPDKRSSDLRDLESWQTIANNAYTWYQTHCLVKQSQLFSHLINDI